LLVFTFEAFLFYREVSGDVWCYLEGIIQKCKIFLVNPSVIYFFMSTLYFHQVQTKIKK